MWYVFVSVCIYMCVSDPLLLFLLHDLIDVIKVQDISYYKTEPNEYPPLCKNWEVMSHILPVYSEI